MWYKIIFIIFHVINFQDIRDKDNEDRQHIINHIHMILFDNDVQEKITIIVFCLVNVNKI